MSKLKGWICPICLAGVSPDFDRCPCSREDKPKQQEAPLVDKQERSYLDKMREQNTAHPSDFNRAQLLGGWCPKCRMRGVVRTHGSYEVCPYEGVFV